MEYNIQIAQLDGQDGQCFYRINEGNRTEDKQQPEIWNAEL